MTIADSLSSSSSGKTSFIIYQSIFLLFFLSCLNSYFHFIPFLTTTPPAMAAAPAPASHLSTSPPNPKVEKGNVERMEERLARARALIKEAARTRKYRMTIGTNRSFVPKGPIYRNPFAFHQSHIEMEKLLKIWPYKEGELPMFHVGPMKDIYSIEGQLIDELESRKSRFLAQNPDEALVFFLPISVVYLLHYFYKPRDFDRGPLQSIVQNYVDNVSSKYPYWNRSSGADHFFASCHDWAPDVTKANPKLYKNFVRVLCNANISEGFQPERDVTMPEIKIPRFLLGPPHKGQEPTNRSILAFFAGGYHGRVRTLLFKHWKDKDNEIHVHNYLPKNQDYFDIMGRTKFCLCPSGFEVASPRVVESIAAGCVPVIISDGYVLPFSDVLDWSRFSVHIPVAKIPEIKKILEGISMDEFLKKQKLVMNVQRHFTLHRPSQPFDLMDMLFHSIWLRRLNVRLVK